MLREETLGGGDEEFKRFAIDGSVDDGLFWGGGSVEAEGAGLLRFLVEALLFWNQALTVLVSLECER
jgi:hypothetical protein